MTTDAQKRAHKAHAARLKAQGVRMVSLRLSEAARERLDELAKVHGSMVKAVEALLLGEVTEPVDPYAKFNSQINVAAEKSTGRRVAAKPEPKPAGYQVQFGPTKKAALKQPKGKR